jgi:HAD superfamily hydrolase (TIGR01509 family)
VVSCRALIFDVDGTIADTEELHRESFNEAFRELGLAFEWDPPQYAQLLRVTGGKERLAHYISQLAVAPAERTRLLARVPELHASKTLAYHRRISAAPVLRAGIARLMAEARSAGMKLAIASTTSPQNIEPLLARLASTGFDVIATGDIVPRKKPAPDIYRLALARLAIAPEEAIAFEDSAHGVAAATAAGLFTIATPSRWTDGEDLGAADRVLRSLGDPAHPCDASDAAQIGAPWLSLERLLQWHARARPRGRSRAQR